MRIPTQLAKPWLTSKKTITNLALIGVVDLESGYFAKVPGTKLREMEIMVTNFLVTSKESQEAYVAAN